MTEGGTEAKTRGRVSLDEIAELPPGQQESAIAEAGAKLRADQDTSLGDPKKVGIDPYLTVQEQRDRDTKIENNPEATVAGGIVKGSAVGLGPLQERQILGKTGQTVQEIVNKKK